MPWMAPRWPEWCPDVLYDTPMAGMTPQGATPAAAQGWGQGSEVNPGWWKAGQPAALLPRNLFPVSGGRIHVAPGQPIVACEGTQDLILETSGRA